MNALIFASILYPAFLFFPGEGDAGHETLAEFEGGTLTAADVRSYLGGLPDSEKIVPEDENGRQEWVRAQMSAAAVEKVFERGEDVRRLLEDESFAKRRRWLQVEALSGSLMEKLREEIELDEADVAQRVAEIQARAQQRSFYSFRRIFLSFSEATSAADRQKIREKAHELAVLAQNGNDFAELAKAHSQAPEAENGGLVNATRQRLEPEVAGVLDTLNPEAVSGVLETAGGCQILKLERKSNPAGDRERMETMARSFLRSEAQKHQRQELLKKLEARHGTALGRFPYKIGDETWSKEEWQAVTAMSAVPEPRRSKALAELILLAREAVARGLKTQTLEAEVEAKLRREAVRSAYYRNLSDFIGALPAEPCRALFDARPERFSLGERVDLDLIFVPLGEDGDAVPTRLGQEVENLRQGGSFAGLAHKISTGPKAESGGALGVVEVEKLGILNPAIQQKVLQMKAGELSEPIFCAEARIGLGAATLAGGYALIKLNEKLPSRARTFEEALQDVRKAYFQEHSETLEEAFKKTLLERAEFRVLRVPGIDEILN